MKKVLVTVLFMIGVTPLIAAELHGRVMAKGLRDSSYAVVYVETGKAPPKPAMHAKMNQKNMQFDPHVLPIVVGQTVDFLNSDSVLHNVFSPDSCADRFNLGTWPQGQFKSYTFTKPCFAEVLCKVHPEMDGYIVAVPTEYFAVTTPNGSYEIKDIPDGTYTVKVWHPILKPAQKSVTIKGSTEADFEISK